MGVVLLVFSVLACWYGLFLVSDTTHTPFRGSLPSLSFLPVPSNTTVPTSGFMVSLLVLLGTGGIGTAVPLLTIQLRLVSVLLCTAKMLFKGKQKRVYPPL